MKYAYAVAVLLALLVFSSGCTQFYSQFNPAPTPAPTKAPTVKPTTAKPTVNVTVNATPIVTTATPTPTQTPTPVPTPTATPTPRGYYLVVPDTVQTDPTIQQPVSNTTNAWKIYQNKDFRVDYPEGWEITETITGVPDPVLYREGIFKPTSRLVTFQGGDGRTNFTVRTADYLNPGKQPFDTTMAWCQRTVSLRLYDVSWTAVSNYQLRYTLKGTPHVTFDVIVPFGSVYYPHVYRERNMASWSHVYTMRFNAYGNLTDYDAITKRMFDSLLTQEINFEPNGEFV